MEPEKHLCRQCHCKMVARRSNWNIRNESFIIDCLLTWWLYHWWRTGSAARLASSGRRSAAEWPWGCRRWWREMAANWQFRSSAGNEDVFFLANCHSHNWPHSLDIPLSSKLHWPVPASHFHKFCPLRNFAVIYDSIQLIQDPNQFSSTSMLPFSVYFSCPLVECLHEKWFNIDISESRILWERWLINVANSLHSSYFLKMLGRVCFLNKKSVRKYRCRFSTNFKFHLPFRLGEGSAKMTINWTAAAPGSASKNEEEMGKEKGKLSRRRRCAAPLLAHFALIFWAFPDVFICKCISRWYLYSKSPGKEEAKAEKAGIICLCLFFKH